MQENVSEGDLEDRTQKHIEQQDCCHEKMELEGKYKKKYVKYMILMIK